MNVRITQNFFFRNFTTGLVNRTHFRRIAKNQLPSSVVTLFLLTPNEIYCGIMKKSKNKKGFVVLLFGIKVFFVSHHLVYIRVLDESTVLYRSYSNF